MPLRSAGPLVISHPSAFPTWPPRARVPSTYDEMHPTGGSRPMPEFSYTDLLPLGEDATDYRQLSAEGITTKRSFGKDFIEIEPGVLSLLTETAMRDIAHLLRPGHLRQLRSILDDPQASPNDRF